MVPVGMIRMPVCPNKIWPAKWVSFADLDSTINLCRLFLRLSASESVCIWSMCSAPASESLCISGQCVLLPEILDLNAEQCHC